jgi:hypothetical protein
VKSFLILFILFLASPGLAQTPPAARKPLGKNQVMALVAAGMDNAQLAKKIEDLGIDFEPTDDYLEALRKAGAQDVLLRALRAIKPEPMTQQQVLALMAGGVASERVTALVKQRGIIFVPDEEYLETLRVAGAGEALIAAVREAGGALPGELDVTAPPNAEVYLDGALAGRAGDGGMLAVKKLKPGSHLLRVTLATKRDFEQSTTITPGAVSKVDAMLTDLPGRVGVTSEPGAEVYLDGTSRGKTDSMGKLVLADVAPGSHDLRVSGQTKHKDYSGTITVSAGQETSSSAYGEVLPGSFRVRATPGAKVFCDTFQGVPNVIRFNGEFTCEEKPGTYTVRVVDGNQPEFRKDVYVLSGGESVIEAPRRALPASGKWIDRLFRSEQPDSYGYYYYMRFYPDGSLVMGGLKVSWADVEGEFMNRKSRGEAYVYQMQGSTIRWSVDGGWPTYLMDYKATIRGSMLFWETAGAVDHKVYTGTYKLVESGAASRR